jgi:hypothetical protein
MRKDDKEIFVNFIARTGMYIYPVDEYNIVSFIHGYEEGTKRECDFTELVKQLLINKYEISYSSDGWQGQVRRLGEKLSLSWVEAFKKATFEIVAD